MDLAPGATHEITWTVTPDKTADAMGNRGVIAKFLERTMKKGQA